jgi:hypothetical protein
VPYHLPSYHSYGQSQEAYKIFERLLQSRFTGMDVSLYCDGLSAACSVVDWKTYRSLILQSQSFFSSKDDLIKIFNEGIIYCRDAYKLDATAELLSSPNWADRSFQLVDLMESIGLLPTSQTMASLLSVLSAHGNLEDMGRVLVMADQRRLKMSTAGLNILLNKYVDDDNLNRAVELFQLIANGSSYEADIVTYGIALKLCLRTNDLHLAGQIVDGIEQKNMSMNPRMNTLLIQLYDKRQDFASIIDLIDRQQDSQLSNYMFSNAISAIASDPSTRHADTIIRWLHRAIMLYQADQAVYTTAILAMQRYQEYARAASILAQMRRNNIPWNKYSVSAAITTYLSWINSTVADSRSQVLQRLEVVLTDITACDASLLTDSAANKIIGQLCEIHESNTACELHLGPLSHTSCNQAVLTSLLNDMQEACELQVLSSEETANKYVVNAMTLVALYRKKEATPFAQRRLRTVHFNSLLRMFAVSKMFPETEKLFRYLSMSTWIPTTFTVAELVRIARLSNNTMLAHDSIVWAAQHPSTFIPSAVINDAVSFVYYSGSTELAKKMYSSVYAALKISHWKGGEFTMDLHNYSRGLAYAAMVCALEELKLILADDDRPEVALVVITGQSLAQQAPAGQGSYLLLSELQDILIEDIYPPLSSSTIPGNPGRLLVHVPNPNYERQS